MAFANIANKVLLETESVRVWELSLPGNKATDWHQHEHPYIYVVLTSGSVRTEYQDGSFDDQNDEIGTAVRHDAGPPHRLINTGGSVYHNIVIELLIKGQGQALPGRKRG
jgi:hypothetical protein